MTMNIARYITLNTGHKMPAIGFGTYQLSGDQLRQALDYALFLGYRHIDTAFSYGNESDIGLVINDRINADKIKRKELFITTKVANRHLKKHDVYDSVECSLSSLKTSYVDLLLIHHPWALKKQSSFTIKPISPGDKLEVEHVDLRETWGALEAVQNVGFAANIGVSNFTVGQLKRIISSCTILPANVQCEGHVLYQQNKLREFCNQYEISMCAYAPLGAYNRPERHQIDKVNLLEMPEVVTIAKSYKKTPAQILLNFLLCKGFAVLPKSGNIDRLKENFHIFNWSLTNEDYDILCSLDRGLRFFRFQAYKGHPEYFESEEF